MQFHEITTADARWAQPKLESAGFASCEFAFINIFMWSVSYGTRIAEREGFVLVCNEGAKTCHFLYPVGGGDLRAAMRSCLDYAASRGKQAMFYAVPESEVPRIEALFPGKFIFSSDRNEEEYLYRVGDLQQLAGKNYQKKRNHISRFCKEHPEYRFERLSAQNLEDVRAFNDAWYARSGGEADEGLTREHLAIEHVLDHYAELDVVGGLIRTQSGVAAYCFGSRICKGVLGTHVEKALHEVNGAYAMINREFARAFGGGYEYINREEDMGQEGLRKAKLSYVPARMEKKIMAVPRVEVRDAQGN